MTRLLRAERSQSCRVTCADYRSLTGPWALAWGTRRVRASEERRVSGVLSRVKGEVPFPISAFVSGAAAR